MKKALSLFLAVLMLFSVCASSMSVFAEDEVAMGECACADCTRIMNGCHCCAACPYIDASYLLACAKDNEGHYKGSTCCGECSGIWPCGCSCSCCRDKSEDPNPDSDPLIPANVRTTIIEAFQNAIQKVSAVFDKIFDAIFEFLKIDGILGKK